VTVHDLNEALRERKLVNGGGIESGRITPGGKSNRPIAAPGTKGIEIALPFGPSGEPAAGIVRENTDAADLSLTVCANNHSEIQP
jgi:hypothetical protein